jgi:hypothetical protein
MPQNPVEVGAVLGHLREHVPPSWSRNGDTTPAILRLDDAVVVNYWTGERQERDEVAVYDRRKKLFPFRLGERVVLALGCGILGKVRFTYTGRTRTAWEDEWPDSRLSLVDLFKRFYPDWTAPADLPSWPGDDYKVVCPLAAHTDRTARITAFGEFTCSRHTGANVYYDDTREAHHLPIYWNAVDVLMRRFGFKDEDAAVAELSRIEDEQLAVLAAEVWGTDGMSRQRIVMLERLIRQHKDKNPKWAKKWNAELAQLNEAQRKEAAKRFDRALAEVASPRHQRYLAQRRRERQRYPD